MEDEEKWKTLKDDEGWEEVTYDSERPLTPWMPEEVGEEVRGYYLGLREFSAADGSTFQKHLLEDEDVVWTINDNVVLSNALREIRRGTAVRIKYLGTRRNRRGWVYKDYSVKIKRSAPRWRRDFGSSQRE